MTESTAVRWQGRVEETFNKLRWADVDAQELACQSIEKEFESKEAGAKLRELFEAEADRIKVASLKNPEIQSSVEKPKEEEPRPLTVGDLLRLPPGQRTLGKLVELRVVEQRKPEPEPEPEEAEPEAEPEPKIEEPRREQKNGPEEAKVPAVVPVLAPAPAWDQAIAAMNREHAIIENVGGKAVIASWEPSTIDPSKRVVVYQNKESFLLRYSNRFVSIEVHDGRGGRATVPLGQWWLGHRDRQQYRGVTFRPAGPKTVNGCLNLWQSWGVKDRTGDWGLIQNHIREVIAGGNKEFADYVERWIAWAIQNPAAQAEVALVLIGPKGIVYVKIIRDLNKIDAFPFNRQRRLCYHALKSTYTSLITAPVSFVGNEQNTVL
jgi:hypothetical protein